MVDYDAMVRGMLSRPNVDWMRFPCVTPSWDNSARKKKGANIFVGSTPDKYQAWLQQAVARASQRGAGDEKIVFINAWNEWAEGNHLEPDLKWGSAYLEATSKVLIGIKTGATKPTIIKRPANTHSVARQLYWKALTSINIQLELLRYLGRGNDK